MLPIARPLAAISLPVSRPALAGRSREFYCRARLVNERTMQQGGRRQQHTLKLNGSGDRDAVDGPLRYSWLRPLVNPHARPFIKKAVWKAELSGSDYATGRGWYGSVVLEFLRGGVRQVIGIAGVPSPGAVLKVTTRISSCLFPPSNCNSLRPSLLQLGLSWHLFVVGIYDLLLLALAATSFSGTTG
jgi:hypothetical protein